MRMTDAMDQLLRAWARLFAIIAALAVVVMLWAIIADVGVRNLTSSSLPGMIEVGETMVVAVIFLGMMQAGVTGEHITVTLFSGRISDANRRWVRLFAWTFSTLFLGWLGYATLTRAMASLASNESRFGILSWPIWPGRIVIAVGVLSMFAVAAWNVARLLQGRPPMGAAAQTIEAQIEYELKAAS